MIYAIISDIHSNLEALSLFLKQIPIHKIEKIICLGDIVGYNASPNQCIKIISSINKIETIRGNHDTAVVTGNYNNFSKNANISTKWTIKKCSNTSLKYLSSLNQGPKIINNSFGICHGSTDNEDKYLTYQFETKNDFLWLKDNNLKLLFFGHTHIPTIFTKTETTKPIQLKLKKITMSPNNFYLINPGSLGQPRDGNPQSSFIIYDTIFNSIEIIRYDYPILKCQKKIKQAKLPQFLGNRLKQGR